MSRISLLRTAALLASLACALPAAAETLVIENAHIYTAGPAGEIAKGEVLVRDGRIAAVGAHVEAPKGARHIDAQGRALTPGFINVGTAIGVDEGDGIEETVGSGVKGGPLSAGVDLQYGFNPDSAVIPVVRLTGTTSAVITPSLRTRHAETDARLFAGQAAAVRLDGAPDFLIRPRIAMVLEGGDDGAERAGGARAAFFVALKAELDQARAFARNPSATDDARGHGLTRADLEALVPVVQGRTPLLVSTHRAADIRALLAFAKTEKLKLVLIGAEEGWKVAPELAREHVSVIVNADEDLPYSFEALGSTLENAARLDAAGVPVVIWSASLLTGEKAVRLQAGRAVAYGLPYGAAMSAITLNAAKAFGLGGEIGSIEPGKTADLVLWNGDPLDTQGAPALILIRGVEQPMTSRQLMLRDRYLKKDDPRPPPYRQ